MAKKATAETIEVAPQEVVVKTAPKKQEYTKQNEWEFKDRVYFLKGDKSPLTLTIPSKHTKKHALLYFDPNTGSQKEIRYATNQASPLKEEQTGEATLGHVRFHDGTLKVSKEKQNLQKLLSIYHPLKNKIYQEFSAIAVAEDELDVLDLQIDALNAAREMDVDHSEAILRVELGSKVSTMSSKELRRDLLLFARKSPQLFIDLANDENVQLRNVALRASEVGIIKLSQDQRTFMWGSNDRKLMTIPFDENPYSAMAAYFKTDEGVEVFRSIEKKMN
tara:strand:- start:5284 stop:6114 length:831 start_codon:yes stop_codon:yes gene_type:complete